MATEWTEESIGEPRSPSKASHQRYYNQYNQINKIENKEPLTLPVPTHKIKKTENFERNQQKLQTMMDEM